MPDREFYVIDTDPTPHEIVNCITTTGHKPELPDWYDPERYRLKENPPQELLNNYRYYWERP
jgi:hypothetical protein